MAELTNEIPDDIEEIPTSAEDKEAELPNAEAALVKKIQERVRSDKEHHKKAFDAMRRDMFVARNGYDPKLYPGDTSYVANICGRHVKMKTAALYAKNPRARARRRETLDFAVWDESPQSLQMAFQTIEMAKQGMQQLQAQPPTIDQTGMAVPPQIPPEVEQAMQMAQEVIQDYQQGTQRRKQIDRLGRTLEVLYEQALREQKPVDFKTGMKKLVRRVCTTAVGYVELGFQREHGPRPEMTEKLADARTRLDHLRGLADKVEDGEITEDDAEMAELDAAIQQLESEPEIILREGLIVDFPPSTRVIPDKLTKSLVGFVGARHVTIEYLYTSQQIEEQFQVDLGKKFTGYSLTGRSPDSSSSVVADDSDGEYGPKTLGGSDGLVCVWKTYDKVSGLVYLTVDGYNKWLRPPAAPDVFVEDFWPVYALTFNDVEDEDTLFPPSDVALLLHQQLEHNRARQGQREHRQAARPRWGAARGALEEEDVIALSKAQPFTVTLMNKDPQSKLSDLLEVIPVPGVDPNLYETNQFMTDAQLVVGASDAQYGGTSRATATESAIAANSTNASDASSTDDLDAFLTVLARAAGQILLREMSEEKVMEIVGPGAFWPHQSLSDISGEVFLDVEAGSSGKPNQAVEMANWEKLLPFLIQMPGMSPAWVARETVRRLDDKADLTEAMAEGIPSIVAMNAMQKMGAPEAQPAPGDASKDPQNQGGEGGQNGPPPPGGSGGSGPAFGSNQV
jgi:hypothetical protein